MHISKHIASINYPEIGFDHILIFKTNKETIDETGEANKNSIKKRVQIVYTGKKGTLDKYQVFLLETECIFHYRLEPYNILIRRLTYVFDECFIGVAQNGTIAEVFNVEFIQYRWAQIRSKLMLEHEGDVFDQHMKEMDDRVKDHDSILKYLQQYSMYGLYFNGYWDKEMPGTYFAHKNTVIEGQNYLLKEELKALNVSSELAEGVLLEAARDGTDDSKQISAYGKYQYINGVLSEAEKTFEMGSVKIKHSASWVGLRKRL